MKSLLTSLLLLIGIATSFAQNHVTIKGRVIDSLSKSPLELSTIAAVDVKDTSLIAYTLSKKTGDFEMSGLPAGKKVKVVISFTSHKSFVKIFTFQKNEVLNLGDIALGSKMLDEVVIRAERPPITIKKDTIEFSAEAFKTRPNAVVEELLKKLPGVQINGDGSITVNGKSVTKVLIDGKQFFGSDIKIATKNLDAAIVGSIQVYDDREGDPNHLISETKVQKIINLKLKKAIKRSIFGKVFGGAGTRGRYESGGLFNLFRDTLQVSVIGLSNNLNRTAFSNDELYSEGGFNRSGGDNLYNGTVNTGGRNWGGGIEKITSSGFNLNTDYGKKLKLNLLYFYSQKNNLVQNSAYVQKFLGDTAIDSRSNTHYQADSYSHAISGLVDWNPDTLNSLHYTPRVTFKRDNSANDSFTDNFNNIIGHLSNVAGSGYNNSTSTELQQDFYYNKRFKSIKDATFTIGHNLQYNPGQSRNISNSDLTSFTSTLPSDNQRRLGNGKNTNLNASVNSNFTYPVTKKLLADITVTGTYNKSSEENYVYSLDTVTHTYDIFLQDQSTYLKRDTWIEDVKPNFTYHITKDISLIAGVSFNYQQAQNKFISETNYHNYAFILPSVRMELGPVSLSYNRSASLPYLSALQPQTIVYNPLYSFTGNPLLKPTINDNLGANFNKYFQASQINLYFYGSYSTESDAIVQTQISVSNGAQSTHFVNRDGQNNANLQMGLYKQFKKMGKWMININTSINGYYRNNLNIINEVEGWQKSFSPGANQNVNLSWNDKIDLNLGAGYRTNYTLYNYGDNKKVTTNNFNMNNNLVVRWPKRIIWETKQQFSYNSQVSGGFQKSIDVISSSVAVQMLKKDRGEIKITGYDLFNQNTSVYRYTGDNTIYDVQNNTLKRYFLLTLTYKFNSLSTK